LKMENAVVTEIYGKHDGRLHFPLKLECPFYQREIFSESNVRTLEPSVIATHELNRAIVTFWSTTNGADALPSDSSHVVLVLNMKCESNIFRLDPKH
jgi:hypothetical protein